MPMIEWTGKRRMVWFMVELDGVHIIADYVNLKTKPYAFDQITSENKLCAVIPYMNTTAQQK